MSITTLSDRGGRAAHAVPRGADAARTLRRLLGAAALVLAVVVGGCDFDVTQPGRAEDTTLDDPAAFQPLVTGMSQRLSHALWQVAYLTAETSREYVEGGRIFTTKLTSIPGRLTREAGGTVGWTTGVQARWVAEDGVRRFRELLPDASSSPLVAQALVHAGFANRLLGEAFCESVIDGGPAGSHRVYLEHAERHFTEAIEVAGRAGREELVLAARAGRASVRVGLADWPGAVSDAAGVPDDFTYNARYTNTTLNQYNILYWANANSPFRTFSVVGTFTEGYYAETGDPRVAWGSDPAVPTAEIATVPWLYPLKYRSVTDPIRLVTGREARLIEAEAALRRGETELAVERLNALRAAVTSDLDGAPLAPWPPTASAEDAWRYLKLERGIELFLEGRRIGDLRRWSEDGSPAADVVDVTDRIRLCLPIPEAELNTNPNLEPGHADPVNPLYTGPGGAS